jgi:DNA-binding CsgD family transcriptional regulator
VKNVAKNASVGFADLLNQMKITNRLLAAQLKDKMGQKEMVGLLASTGATNQDIAAVLDTTPGTIATTLRRLKGKNSNGANKAGRRNAQKAND